MHSFPPLLFCTALLTSLWFPPMDDPKANSRRSWPMFGGGPSRNMVNPFERNLPATWSVEEGKLKNIKWEANLGGQTVASPVVADGRVFVGTNNAQPRDPNMKKPKAVLMAFRESDGKFLWQNLHNIYGEYGYRTSGLLGLISTPAVKGGRIYYAAPDCEVFCANAENGKIYWSYPLMRELGVVPFHANFCSPLVIGELVFVTTANGIDDDGNIKAPKAPSFVALHKDTGKLVWQSNLPGERIIEGQWSSPAFAIVNDVAQVIFAGGDSVIYSFDPPTGKLLWKCDCLPFRRKKDADFVDNYFVATPVVLGDKLFIGMGTYPDHARREGTSFFLCLDVTKKGDVSLKSYDAKAVENKDSALVWAYGGPVEPRPKKGRRARFGATMSTAAVHDGLVYITEENGYLHCLDAATGQRNWIHDLLSAVWTSPYWVDGRIFVCGEGGDVTIFAHGKDLKILATVEVDDLCHSTPAAANGALFVATHSKLYAISSR